MGTSLVDSSGSDAGGAAPSIGQLIASSSGAAENDGATSLDDLRDELRSSEHEPPPPGMPAPAHRRRKHRKSGRPVGRPRKDSRAGSTSAPLPSETPPTLLDKKITRAELAAQLEAMELRVQQLDADLLTARARGDADKIGELDNLVQMVAIFAYGQIAEVRGPHWAITGDEAEKIGKPTASALAPYAARLNVSIPWVSAVLAIADVTWARVRIDQANVRRLENVP